MANKEQKDKQNPAQSYRLNQMNPTKTYLWDKVELLNLSLVKNGEIPE